MNGFKKGGVLAVCAFAAAAAQAADVSDQGKRGFELGIGLGQANTHIDVPGAVDGSETKAGYNVFGGYRFDRYLSLEAGYLDAGNYSVSQTDGVNTGVLSEHLRAAQLSAVGTLPLGNFFGVFARVGADHWWASGKATYNAASVTETGTATSFLWGFGAEAFWDGAKVRLEYQQSKHNEDVFGFSADLRQRYLSASIVWLF